MSATLESPVATSINEVLQRYPDAGRDALIPILQEVQEAEGFLSQAAMIAIGEHLKLPASKVFGVATFYNQFRFKPLGKYNIVICRGTACHVKGSAEVLETLKDELGIEAGDTTPDGNFSLEVVACIGACGLAPVINVNGEFHAELTPKKVRKILNAYRKEAAR